VLEGLLTLLHERSVLDLCRDLFDIAVVAYAVYRLLLLLRGTRAMQVGLGLALVVLVYIVAQRAGLATAYTLLDRFLASFLLLVVVIFQSDIRRALMRVGTRPFLLRWRKAEETSAVEEVISACTLLAQRRIGALMVFEREASLNDFVAQGTVLDAEVTRELLYTVFLPAYENPLHDGAVIIKNARVIKAGTFLPLTANPTLDRTLGTRHRAALGISEETDAVVIIVSEERGQVSLCFNGNIVRGLDAQSLRQALYGL
jgi:diadenylate cyclase